MQLSKRNKTDIIKPAIVTFVMICILFGVILLNTPVQANSDIANNLYSDEIIILFQTDVSSNEQTEILYPYKNVLTIVENIENYTLCKVKESGSINTLINELSLKPEVDIVERNSNISLLGITNDTYSDAQWSLKNTGTYTHIVGTSTGTTISTAGVDLNIEETWKLYNKNDYKTREVVVAIVDTGVDTKHIDLKNNIWRNKSEIASDGIDNDKNGYIDDINGWDFYNDDSSVCHYQYNTHLKMNLASPSDDDDHGTHCAGIIAATANNKAGIAGVASNINVKIMPLKIHGGVNGKGSIANAIKAIKYATMMGADICNMSWGTENYSAALKTVMQESPMLFITAAGNDGSNNNQTPIYPASYDLDNLISVTFIDSNGNLTLDSNYGNKTVDIAAPGTDIFSTVVGNYSSMSGSSMAAPHVSAIAAMLYSYSSNLYAANVKEIILGNIKFLDELDGLIINPGIPDALSIVSSFRSLDADEIPPELEAYTIYDKQNIIVNIDTNDYGGSGIRTIKYAIGERSTSYFKRGTNGLSITNNTLTLAKAGIYTIYLSDYSGNETSFAYEVEDDTTPPSIEASYTVSNDYSKISINASVSDSESGIKIVKYASGLQGVNNFLSSSFGTSITEKNGEYAFKVTKPGRYTIFTQDYRGNKSTFIINARIVSSTSLTLNRTSKVLGVGKYFRLYPTLVPSNSTDIITYKSSNKNIVTVSETGLLKGISPGKATITAITSSGISKICTVTVRYPSQ